MDGGTLFIIQGVLMYLLRKHRKLQVCVFCALEIVIYIIIPIAFMPGITIKFLFTDAYEWMGIAAAIFMLIYNGERGKGSKKLFYWFYPLHIYGLCALSYIIYYIVN